MKMKKITLLTSGFSAAILALTAHAATPITIDSVISTGTVESYEEAPVNMWMLLDNSGSMGGRCEFEYAGLWDVWWVAEDCNPTRGPGAFYLDGFISYDPTITYPIPKSFDGSDMPLPTSIWRFYTQPFRDNRNGVPFNQTSLLSFGNRRYSDISQTLCRDALNRQNCVIWQNYYSSRMRTLKSALSLSLLHNNPAAERLRIGYMPLHQNGSDPINTHRFPLNPLSLADPDANGVTNRNQFHRWLYSMTPNNGTPLRQRAADLYSAIKNNSEKQTNTNNPFLVYPGKEHNKDSNPILSCRRNYVVMLSDGGWNTSSNNNVITSLNSEFNNQLSSENNFTLPDGKSYSPLPPYRKAVTNDGVSTTNVITLGDIAMRGWATDIDGLSDNNNLAPKTAKIDGVVQNHPLNGDSYWHPYNDPASWQHINTFTIAFGLNRRLSINPPKIKGESGIDSSYLENSHNWQVTTSGESSIALGDTVNDLANAALNGRGRLYNVDGPAEMKKAFDDIFNEAVKGGEKPGIKGSGGITGSSQFGLDGHYTTSYDHISFTGELVKYNLFDGKESSKSGCFTTPSADARFGQLCDKPAWKAGELLTNRSTPRTIISSKQKLKNAELSWNHNIYDTPISDLNYQQINFLSSDMSSYQKKIFNNNFTGYLQTIKNNDGHDAARSALINYTWGSDAYEADGHFRQRIYKDLTTGKESRNILGAMMRSAPQFAGIPHIGKNHPDLLSNDFIKFVQNYIYNKDGTSPGVSPVDKDHVNMIYVGSNDGMLHAFKAKDGEEVFAYVPNALYKTLPKLVGKDEKTSFVDGGIDVQTFKLNGDWKQILVGAMGGGAKGLYSLDITDPKKYIANNKAIVRWEYTDEESKLFQKSKKPSADFSKIKSNMGNILAKPGSVELSDGTPATIVGNGYNSESGKATLIVINLETGKPIQELVLDNKTYTNSTQPNGLSPVTFLSYAGKKANIHRPDRAYAGDLQGNLWVFDLTKATAKGGVTVVNNKPLFTAKYKDSDKEVRQPITVAPLVKEHPTKYGFLVHFGTGSLFSEEDISSKVNNSIYAIWDDWVATNKSGLPSPRSSVVERDHLRNVKFTTLAGDKADTKSGSSALIRQLDIEERIKWAVKGDKFSTHRRGWLIDLLPGERAWQSAYTDFGSEGTRSVSYNTVRYDNEEGADSVQLTCGTLSSGVSSWVLAFNEKDASQPLKYSGVLDADKDGMNTEGDKIGSPDDLDNDEAGINASGLMIKDIVFNPAESNLYASLAIFGGDDSSGGGSGGGNGGNDDPVSETPNPIPQTRVCTWKNSLSSSALSNNITVKQNCLRSHTGSWLEVREENK